MVVNKLKSRWIVSGAVLGLGLVVAAATCVGVLVGTRVASQQTPSVPIPLNLQAASAAHGKSLSMATGSIDGNVEALFVLDHLSGKLQCWIMSPRTGAIGGFYQTNVMQDLKVDKGGEADYLLVTGSFLYNGGVTGNNFPAQSLAYVANVNTGAVVGYSLSYNKTGIQRGIVQRGELLKICEGDARDIAIRDQ